MFAVPSSALLPEQEEDFLLLPAVGCVARVHAGAAGSLNSPLEPQNPLGQQCHRPGHCWGSPPGAGQDGAGSAPEIRPGEKGSILFRRENGQGAEEVTLAGYSKEAKGTGGRQPLRRAGMCPCVNVWTFLEEVFEHPQKNLG